MSLLGGAWTAHVIWYLREGERCFSELQMDLQGVSAKVLTARLRELVQEGIVHRVTRQTSPPTVWYALTPGGRDLANVLVELVEAAQRLHAPRESAAEQEIFQ
ncbi:MAG: helix-turn-helix domain-containing protein [Bryobacteraceae bacterium]|nr:helix-turn-helix domain-containing protein [Bryobacteraceae bacterium]